MIPRVGVDIVPDSHRLEGRSDKPEVAAPHLRRNGYLSITATPGGGAAIQCSLQPGAKLATCIT